MRIFLLLLIFTFSSLQSQTHVSGSQSGIWEKVNSPYLVEGEISINSNDTLIIEHGVQIIFQGNYKFLVYGTLIANGILEDSIKFTASDVNAGWQGITFSETNSISILKYSIFEYGKTGLDYPYNNGGAISLINSDAKILNCLFINNDATGDDDGMGGAIYGYNTGNSPYSDTKISKCRFINNHAFGEGGAIKLTGDFNSIIDSCQFFGNNSLYGGGAISFYSVFKTKIKNCLFYGNYTEYSSGGAIEAKGYGCSFYLTNSTIYQNEARHGDGGAIYLAYTSTDIVNTIVWNNPGMYSNNIFLDFESSAEIFFSDLIFPEGATGSNNISSEPQFVNAENFDFSLTPHSPCVDAGTNFFVTEGDTLVNILNYYGSSADIGAYEFYPPGDISDLNSTTQFNLYQNYPNPFNPETTIAFSVPKNNIHVNIIIYDELGKKVKTILDKNLEAGKYSINFNAEDLSSGIYFYRLVSGKYEKTRKMILLK